MSANVLPFSNTVATTAKPCAVVVTGAAGYIGYALVESLLETTQDVVIGIDLSPMADSDLNNYRAVRVINSYGNAAVWKALLDNYNVHTIYHVGATSLVAPSMIDPMPYYVNNVGETAKMIEAVANTSVKRIIFSSSAAVYGNPVSQDGQCKVEHSSTPINPYGKSKAMGESLMHDAYKLLGMDTVCLRYFNVAGATPTVGQLSGASHVLPRILESALHNQTFHLFGTNYQTHDGTAVRDYVHVNDVVNCNILAAKYVVDNPGAHVYNVGAGVGNSVLDIVSAVNRVVGTTIQYKEKSRRTGDPAVLIADIANTVSDLKWQPELTVTTIIKSAYDWHDKYIVTQR
jgi:UDP-glucose 4-epimerase